MFNIILHNGRVFRTEGAKIASPAGFEDFHLFIANGTHGDGQVDEDVFAMCEVSTGYMLDGSQSPTAEEATQKGLRILARIPDPKWALAMAIKQVKRAGHRFPVNDLPVAKSVTT